LIEAQLKIDPEQSDVMIADKIGTTDKTVAAARRDLEATSEIPRLEKRKGKDGKKRVKPKAATEAATKKEKPFVPTEAAGAVVDWLHTKRQTWPERYQENFVPFVVRMLQENMDDAVDGIGSCNTKPVIDAPPFCWHKWADLPRLSRSLELHAREYRVIGRVKKSKRLEALDDLKKITLRLQQHVNAVLKLIESEGGSVPVTGEVANVPG
jgi:hypothetical protein